MERHTQYQNHILTIEIPQWGSTGTIEYLKGMTFCESVGEIPWEIEYKTRAGKIRSKTDYSKQTRRLRFKFNHYQVAAGYFAMFKRDLANIFREGFLTITESAENRYKDDWELLEHELFRVDWSADMSDDHSHWCGLQRSKREIGALVEELKVVDSFRLSNLLQKYYAGNGWAGWVKALDPGQTVSKCGD